MVMALRLAEHVSRLARGVGARGDLALTLQVVQRAIDGRKRDLGLRRFEIVMDLGGGKKAPLAAEDVGNQFAGTGDVIGSNAHPGAI